LVGDAGYANISDSFATGSVTGVDDVGGLIGDFESGSFIGTNTWVNYTTDNATACLGSGTPGGTGTCTP